MTPTNQAKNEIIAVLDLIDYVNQTLGMKKGQDYRYRLSLGNRRNTKKYYQDDQAWDEAEQILRQVLISTKAPYFEAPDEAAFYGPKIDVQIKNVLGKEETAFTVQYDFVMPKRFNMTYINEKSQKEKPVVIHRSSLGAFERTMAFLIEHYAGAFPTWLSPTQVVIIPITDKQNAYAKKVAIALKDKKIRVELDSRSESMQSRIRDAEMQKIPYVIVVGEKEAKSQKLAIRARKKGNLGLMTIEKFTNKIQSEIEKKTIN